MIEWKNLYRGLIMGISDLIPGVSGGTIAVVLGIYDRLLEAISGFFSKEWRRHIGFLFPLAVGMGTALLALSRFIEYLLEYHYEPTQFFFMGLIIGVLPLIVVQAEVKYHFKIRHLSILFISAVLVASMAFINQDKSADPITSLTLFTVLGLFLSGWLASMAMLMPGISGSFVLLLLGVYSTAIHALSELNVLLIAIIGSGVIVGFIVSSKGIRYLLFHHTHITYAVIIGLIIGSVFVVFPGFPDGSMTRILSVVTFMSGIGLSLLFRSKRA
jgi:putative membrane protein